MRVFILCTGRTGSKAIITACQHIENFTSAHESLSAKSGKDRFNYPQNHIEADNRLSWELGALNKQFGDDAFYIHMRRDRDKVAQSFERRFYSPRSIIDAFCEGIRMTPPENMNKDQRLQACYDYIDTVNANIELFLVDKTNTMQINIEEIQEQFPIFWEKIGAKGNLEKALNEFSVSHNKSSKRRLNLFSRWNRICKREWRHFRMSLKS